MAVSGLGLFLFVIAHMVGNLQVFLGRAEINRYGNFLQTTPEILWPARIGLLVLVGMHICIGISLAVENMQARETPYAVKRVVKATVASRTMVWSGLIILSFICFHLAHFTLMSVHPEYRDMHDALGQHDVYGMIVAGFSSPAVTGFYLLSVGLLSFHLSHGVGSMFQSLGLNNEVYIQRIDCTAKLVAVVLFLGYASIPTAVYLGVVK
jgi:succinate dehydrogenase / fumarate reductase cytochrome b subunit